MQELQQVLKIYRGGRYSMVGRLIREARVALHLSQRDFGKLLASAARRDEPYSQATISDLERDKMEISPEFLAIVAQVLGKEPAYFDNPQILLLQAPTTPRPQIRSPRSTEMLAFGLTDTLRVRNQTGGMLQFDFHSSRNDQTLMVTKFPVQLLTALERALEIEDSVTPFAGENFQGRVCSFAIGKSCLVAEFHRPQPVGYLIHMEREEIEELKTRLSELPFSPHRTD